MNSTRQGVLVSGLLLAAQLGHAQALEPRSYSNVPIGQTFVVLGYIRSEGDLTPTATSPLQDAELTLDVGVAGFAHTFALAGSSAKFDMTVSRQCFEGSGTFSGQFVEARRCGYGDPNFRLTWNFYGAPAMQLKEYRSWKPGLVIGASLQVSAPVGSYEEDKLINFGANRWMVRPGLGLSYEIGRWHVDAITSVRLFEDNDDYFGGFHVEQDPIYAVQSHLIYNFNKGKWLSLNANFFWGGESRFDGVAANNRQENSRLGITFSMPLSVHHSIKVAASTGVVTTVGNDGDALGIFWQYRF